MSKGPRPRALALAAAALLAAVAAPGAADLPAGGGASGVPAPGGDTGTPVAEDPGTPAPEPAEPTTPGPDGGSDGPVEASVQAEGDGSANASLAVEPGDSTSDGSYPTTGAADVTPEPNGTTEARAATFPEPGGRCQETPVARLYVVALPGVSAGATDLPTGPHRERLEDPRDHPAWECTMVGSPGRVEGAGGGPAAASGPPDPLLGSDPVPAPPADPARASAPPSSAEEPRSSDGGARVWSADAAASRRPAGQGLAAGAATLALAALAVPAAAALYRRLTRDELLENETRAALLEMVRDRPGLTAAEACERLDVHYDTARHHLDLLAEFGEVEAMELGGRIRYFENHQRFGRIAKHLVSCLDSETKRAVLMAVARSGAIRSGDVAEDVDVAPSTASYHLRDLRERGLVERRRDGRSALYALEDGVLPALMELAPTPGE